VELNSKQLYDYQHEVVLINTQTASMTACGRDEQPLPPFEKFSDTGKEVVANNDFFSETPLQFVYNRTKKIAESEELRAELVKNASIQRNTVAYYLDEVKAVKIYAPAPSHQPNQFNH
jgi:hypothetical protein